MRSCFRQALGLVLGALLLGILMFVLLYTGLLTLSPDTAGGIVWFTTVALLSGGGLLTLAAAILHINRTPALADAWLCCGEAAAISAPVTLLATLFTALAVSREVGLYLGVSLICFFLVLFLGFLVCFLRRYITCRCSS